MWQRGFGRIVLGHRNRLLGVSLAFGLTVLPMADFSLAAGFASNGFGERSPAGYSMTALFPFVILGAATYHYLFT
jgi:hypothetical protein